MSRYSDYSVLEDLIIYYFCLVFLVCASDGVGVLCDIPVGGGFISNIVLLGSIYINKNWYSVWCGNWIFIWLCVIVS